MFQCFESVECSLPIGGARGRYGAVIWTWPRPCIREPFGVVVRAAASGCLLSLPAEHTGERTRGICTSWSRFFLFGRDGGGRSLVGFRAREKQCGHDSLSCLPAGARSLAQSRRLRHSRAGVSPVSRFPRRPVCSILDSVWNWAGRRFQIRAAARRSAARAVGSRADRRSRGSCRTEILNRRRLSTSVQSRNVLAFLTSPWLLRCCSGAVEEGERIPKPLRAFGHAAWRTESGPCRMYRVQRMMDEALSAGRHNYWKIQLSGAVVKSKDLP
jgi:hypothetical protein